MIKPVLREELFSFYDKEKNDRVSITVRVKGKHSFTIESTFNSKQEIDRHNVNDFIYYQELYKKAFLFGMKRTEMKKPSK